MNTTELTEEVTDKKVKDRLKNSSEAVDAIKWLYRETTTRETRKSMFWIMVILFFSMAINIAQPAVMGYIFEGLTAKNSTYVIAGLLLLPFLMYIQKKLMKNHDQRRVVVMDEHLKILGTKLTRAFFKKSLGQHTLLAETLSQSAMDKGKWKAIDLQRTVLFDVTSTVLLLTISLIGLLIISFTCGLIMLAVFIIYISFSIYLNNQVSNVCTPLEVKFKAVFRRYNERMTSHERVINNAKDEYEVETMENIYEPLMLEERKFWFWFTDVALYRSYINVIGFSSVVAIGAWRVWNDKILLSELFPLFAWATLVSNNMWRLSDLEYSINRNLPPVTAMIKAFNIVPDIVDKPDAIVLDHTVPHRIEIVGLSHTYPEKKGKEKKELTSIKNISFTIEEGQNVSLLGPSGSGKTTLIRQLLRYYDPNEGAILIDGIDLKDIQLESWRKGIGYVPQAPQVLDGTIKYNLMYGLTEVQKAAITDDHLWEIMTLLKVDFGERLKEGLETIVGEKGIKLSGGQAQRLMIGAAVLKKPWFLIIDEGTSSLDATTEKAVQAGLAQILSNQDTSALIIAHRLSTVRRCDKHIVLRPVSEMQPGESQICAEAYSFEELVTVSPTFCRLARDQEMRIDSLYDEGSELELAAA